MAIDYISLGPVPYDEPCAQLGESNYNINAVQECRRYLRQLVNQFGLSEYNGFEIKVFPYEINGQVNEYFEVVVCGDDSIPEALDFMLNVESNLPQFWK